MYKESGMYKLVQWFQTKVSSVFIMSVIRLKKLDSVGGYMCNKPMVIGQKLRKFTQLKRNKRFDNFIMLVWVQGSPFHIAAGSHPVQEAWGHKSFIQG